ncbi:MAG: hypothetical protein HYV77_01860 [Candidatus Wildermuthbacteria bacterium]|nr:hypothetical protein [Candidatus Wildermuthbacteria bacterium]
MDQELRQCKECGFRYIEKEWAEKCEAWCREHKSCNLEIISHGTPPEEPKPEDGQSAKFLTGFFYSLVGFAGSLGFFLLLYWSLRLNSSITSLVTNTASEPVYFWMYAILTIAAVFLFGLNLALFVYRWRRYGFGLWSFGKGGSSSGLASIAAFAASACPVCGSTFLSAVGIAGGLSAFPFGGLELKALSVAFLVLPIWFTTRELKKASCRDGTCPVSKDDSFKERDIKWSMALVSMITLGALVGWNMLKADPVVVQAFRGQENRIASGNLFAAVASDTLLAEIQENVLPSQGFQSKIALKNSIVKLVEEGVIDKEKVEELYEKRGGIPYEMRSMIEKPSDIPIILTSENAGYYVNMLWALGLSNYMSTNETSPIKGKSLFNFASTGGWTLGKAKNGGEYFNKFKIVELSLEQEAVVTEIAKNTYRPCCDNSTFFQDCNHGSALLGLLSLGVTQGLSEEELYKEALAFNSFWFANTYIETALYFKAVKGVDWKDIDAKLVMSKEFSSASGWYKNIHAKVQDLGLIPKQQGGSGCGV